jgi:eukaryotic-like serine/threonine-protein kinase
MPALPTRPWHQLNKPFKLSYIALNPENLKRFIHTYITSRPLWVNLLVALGLVFLFVLLFLFSLNAITHHGEARTVPSVVGKTLQNVQSMLEEKGFEVVVQDSVYYDSLPPSAIIKQVPEADAVVKVNRTIYVTINRVIPPDIDMPNLVGYSLRNAEMTLKNLGLRLGDTTFKPDFAKNSVLEQLYNDEKIAPGTKIRVGSTISLVLGSGIGEEAMPVPRLVGLTFSEARILLEAQGLSLGSVIPSPLVKDNETAFVVRQDPSPHDAQGRTYSIRTGQMVNLWLDVTMPVRDTTTTPAVEPPDDQQ